MIMFLMIVLASFLVLAGCSEDSSGQDTSGDQTNGDETSEQNEEEEQSTDEPIEIQYSHPNAPESVAGRQAQQFADLVSEKTDGRVTIQVFPSGQLGNLQEITEGVKLGTIPISHNTMAANGSLFSDLAALDTPYLFKDVDHMSRVMDMDSPLMETLNERFVEESGVRLLYTFYFGTRHLTADQPIKHPDDLSNVKIRSIPWDIYTTTVEGMGAEATPVDWSEVPTALQTGVVNGQENPLDVVVSNSLYELQDYLMLTGHIIASSGVIINEETWQSIPTDDQELIMEAANEARDSAIEWNKEIESSALTEIKEKGMEVIGEEEGLDVDAFEQQITELIQERFSDEYGYIYDEVNSIE
ncbi:TRAP transporter substrate-binding protein [Aquibacillus halophilus]|nr:TRAP transporter substrate-binding protein [Aquibacillus halophilus]